MSDDNIIDLSKHLKKPFTNECILETDRELLLRHIKARQLDLTEYLQIIEQHKDGYSLMKDNMKNTLNVKAERLYSLIILAEGIDPDSEDWKVWDVEKH